MATLAGKLPLNTCDTDILSGTPRAHAIDRWIFVAMAVWFIVIVLSGFVPDALMKVGMVAAGKRPPFPLILHVHAAAMGSFLLLLLGQSLLMATGRRELHMRVGIAAFLLVAFLVVVGFMLAPTIYHQFWTLSQTAPADARRALQQQMRTLDNILLAQISIGILFPLFMAIALTARKASSGLHKRMMFLATAIPLPAAISRITWLPNTFPKSPLGNDLWVLAALAPMVLWDLARNRRVHEAYWIWLCLYLPVTMLVLTLWDTPWWHATARHIMGA